MIYAEASFFDGAHFQHIADREEHTRLSRARKRMAMAREERRDVSRRGGVL